MKKLYLLPIIFLLLLSACKDEDEPTPETKITVEVRKQIKSSSGDVSKERTTAIIQIWEAQGRDFDVSKSPDIHLGNAYDSNSATYKTIKYGAIGSRMVEKIEPGRYFLYVLLPKSSEGSSLVYSYTYFTVEEGEQLSLQKTFSYNLAEGAFEDWNKNK